MATQEVDLPVSPTGLLARAAGEPLVFALDGGSTASWGCGQALLGYRPRATLRVAATGDAVVRAARVEQRWRGDPFALLDRFCREWAPAATLPGLPQAGGVVVALSYDLRHWVEGPRRGSPAFPGEQTPQPPVLHAASYDWLLSYTYADRRYQLSAGAPAALPHIAAQLERLAARPAPAPPVAARARIVPDLTQQHYLDAVHAVLEYIAAGDVYQVNLAQRFIAADAPAPAALFAAMQREHPVPFAAYVDAGDFVLVSNSPECFLTRHADTLATFPVKGTRRRGADARSDQALAQQLATDAKERAEHVMIVDLERNDLGRVCRTGSVRVDEFARVHTFPSLHHMVSKVSGRLRPHTPLADVLRATFPGGSITGAPKIRAMQLINELEAAPRIVYTGAIGYASPLAGLELNVAIRTFEIRDGKIGLGVGGGIVSDSDPRSELAECYQKAAALIAALGAGVEVAGR